MFCERPRTTRNNRRTFIWTMNVPKRSECYILSVGVVHACKNWKIIQDFLSDHTDQKLSIWTWQLHQQALFHNVTRGLTCGSNARSIYLGFLSIKLGCRRRGILASDRWFPNLCEPSFARSQTSVSLRYFVWPPCAESSGIIFIQNKVTQTESNNP